MSRSYKRLKLQVYTRDKYICWKCGIVTNPSIGNSDTSSSVDHYIPKSKGGSDSILNLRTACRKCNNNRHSEIPEDLSQFGHCHALFIENKAKDYRHNAGELCPS